jgi:hypothetical protein
VEISSLGPARQKLCAPSRPETISNGAFNGWSHVGGSDTTYAVVAVGDYFGNGTDDILFRNNSTGDTWFGSASMAALRHLFRDWSGSGRRFNGRMRRL